MISSQMNPLESNIYHQITSILESKKTDDEKKIIITQICVKAISQAHESSRSIHQLLHTIEQLQNENADFVLYIRAVLEKQDILVMQNSELVAQKEELKEKLVRSNEKNGRLNDLVDSLEREKFSIQTNVNGLRADLATTCAEHEQVTQRIAILTQAAAQNQVTIQNFKEERDGLIISCDDAESRVMRLQDENRDIAVKLAEKNEQALKYYAEKAERKRLKKIFVEQTFARQIVPQVPFWSDRLEGIKNASFFTYLNPICATTWLNVSDKISLAGRGRTLWQAMDRMKKEFPHQTKLQNLSQIMRNYGLGHVIRSEDVYVQEYVESLSENQ